MSLSGERAVTSSMNWTTPVNSRRPCDPLSDATLRGQANVDPLNRVTGNWGVAGRAELDVRVTGDPPDLSYFGTVKLTNGLVNAPILQPVESINATLTLDDRIVRIDEFVGLLGGDGSRSAGNVTGNGENCLSVRGGAHIKSVTGAVLTNDGNSGQPNKDHGVFSNSAPANPAYTDSIDFFEGTIMVNGGECLRLINGGSIGMLGPDYSCN